MLLNKNVSNHKTVIIIFVLLVVGYFVLNTGNSDAYAQRTCSIFLVGIPVKPKHQIYIVTNAPRR